MKLTAHNLKSNTGNEIISFVIWSKKGGGGMVNVFIRGGDGGEMMSLEGARQYWKDMVSMWGYSQAPSTVVEPC